MNADKQGALRDRNCRRALVLILTVSIGIDGCSYQASSAAFTPEAECARRGDRYNPGVGGHAFCEEGFPFGRHD
jgi:hypothetical protein